MSKTIRLLVGLSALALVSPAAMADSLSIEGSQLGFTLAESLTSASYTNELISSGSLPGGNQSGSYYARAEFGDLGLSYTAAATSSILQNTYAVGGEVTVESNDMLHIGGAPLTGLVSMNILVDGDVTATDAPNSVSYPAGPYASSVGFVLGSSSGETYYEDSATCENTSPCSASTDVNINVILPLSVYGFDVSLESRLIDEFYCTGASFAPCAVTGDFAHSARIGGVTILDANGNVVPGVTITSDSGYDYTQPLSDAAASTPEPPSFGLVLTGLLALFLLIRRRTLPRGLQESLLIYAHATLTPDRSQAATHLRPSWRLA